MKYIDADLLRKEIEFAKSVYNNPKRVVQGVADAFKQDGRAAMCDDILKKIDSLQQEQPDNEDIDKVAQELYEHLYELKRRNNVPANLYDKQEIIDLWKAGIVYGRSHPKHEQPEVECEDERHMTQTIGNILRWADEHPKEQKPNIELIQKSWYMEGYHDREFNNEPKWIIKTGEGGPRYEENPKYGQIIDQNPAEWSEEDRRIADRIQMILEFYDRNYPGDGDIESEVPKYINWLKSLRPSWKPSEDEERLINTSISFLKDFADKGYENAVECIDWLKSKLNGNTCK